MAKPSSKDQGRRAVVEQMRREQKRKERQRTYAVVAVAVAVALVIIGLGAYPLLKQKSANGGSLESLGVPTSQAGCRPVVKKAAQGNNDHKPEGTKVTYADAPPAFGPHYPVTAPMQRKFYTAQDRPALEYLVHNLEHGYNILWYDQTVADNSDQLATVKAIASKFDGTELKDKFIAVPWTGEDGKPFPGGAHVALTHWTMGSDPQGTDQQGVWEYCAAPSGQAVATFVKDYPYSDSPEPGAM